MEWWKWRGLAVEFPSIPVAFSGGSGSFDKPFGGFLNPYRQTPKYCRTFSCNTAAKLTLAYMHPAAPFRSDSSHGHTPVVLQYEPIVVRMFPELFMTLRDYSRVLYLQFKFRTLYSDYIYKSDLIAVARSRLQGDKMYNCRKSYCDTCSFCRVWMTYRRR